VTINIKEDKQEMAKLKYANYILTEAPVLKYKKMENGPNLKQILMLNGEEVKGAFHVNCCWLPAGPNPGVFEAHVHPHDEVIGFIGTNPDDSSDLGAEAVLWIDDEKYVINKSFVAFFPKGLVHCPLIIPVVKRPIFHFDIQIASGRPEFQWVKKQLPKKQAKDKK
jgi:hypothetical protein